MNSQPTEHPPIRPVWMDQWLEYPETVPEGSCAETLEMVAAYIRVLEGALRPFTAPHIFGDNYVQFAPRLIRAAREALASSESVAATPEVRS